MEVEKFAIICKRALDQHFKNVGLADKNGHLIAEDGSRSGIFYPTTILCSKTDEALSVELVGVSENPSPLKIKKYSKLSFEKLISHYDKVENSKAKYNFAKKGSGLANILVADADQFNEKGLERFPIAERFKTKIFGSQDLQNSFSFSYDFLTARLSNTMIVKCKDNTLRARHIYEMLIFKNEITEDELQQNLNEYLDFSNDGVPVFGIQKINTPRDLKGIQVSYLHNMILRQEIHETTIGDYLNENSGIILNTLGHTRSIYEPTLDWIEKTSDNTDNSINPDFLLQRKDGFYDICDLKKGLVNKKSLTKDERRRRRFIDAVNEGIAQLDNYAEYFTFAQNAKHAEEKYGVTTNNPLKILIIGNMENTRDGEVKQALRGRPDLLVIDYDSIISMFLANITNEATSN
ncbi:DUF4263 domain-containing protein [Serratia marcescens]|nr:DUF4263 domain-containing protein [Serratia marcescens]